MIPSRQRRHWGVMPPPPSSALWGGLSPSPVAIVSWVMGDREARRRCCWLRVRASSEAVPSSNVAGSGKTQSSPASSSSAVSSKASAYAASLMAFLVVEAGVIAALVPPVFWR